VNDTEHTREKCGKTQWQMLRQVVHITGPVLPRFKYVYFYIISHGCTNYFKTRK